MTLLRLQGAVLKALISAHLPKFVLAILPGMAMTLAIHSLGANAASTRNSSVWRIWR